MPKNPFFAKYAFCVNLHHCAVIGNQTRRTLLKPNQRMNKQDRDMQITTVFRMMTHGRRAVPLSWAPRLGMLLLPLWLVACAVPAPRPEVARPLPTTIEPSVAAATAQPTPERVLPRTEPEPVAQPEPEPAPAAPVAPPTPPAALGLIAQADTAAAGGDWQRSAQHLERALRIAPRDATLWHRLAQVRQEQGDHRQVELAAMRSIQLGTGDRRLTAANWRLIAEARTALGDHEGAQRARDEALRVESALG